MTVIQLLVDIIRLYDSSPPVSSNDNNNDDKEEENKKQELLKKALFAVSAAARGNVDVQNALLVKHNDQSSNGSNQTEHESSSELLDSLYNISVNTNKTHTGIVLFVNSTLYNSLFTYSLFMHNT